MIRLKGMMINDYLKAGEEVRMISNNSIEPATQLEKNRKINYKIDERSLKCSG
jgi:hypothetical protein